MSRNNEEIYLLSTIKLNLLQISIDFAKPRGFWRNLIFIMMQFRHLTLREAVYFDILS